MVGSTLQCNTELGFKLSDKPSSHHPSRFLIKSTSCLEDWNFTVSYFLSYSGMSPETPWVVTRYHLVSLSLHRRWKLSWSFLSIIKCQTCKSLCHYVIPLLVESPNKVSAFSIAKPRVWLRLNIFSREISFPISKLSLAWLLAISRGNEFDSKEKVNVIFKCERVKRNPWKAFQGGRGVRGHSHFSLDKETPARVHARSSRMSKHVRYDWTSDDCLPTS